MKTHTRDNYNNTHKTTNNNTHNTTNNNTHKTTTTIHTRQLQQHTRSTNNNYTQYNLKLATKHTRHITIQHVQKVNNTTVRKYCTQFPVFFPTHTVLTLSPQPFTSHHFTTHINFSHKVSFPPFPTCRNM